MSVLGIDLSTSSKKPSTYLVLDEEGAIGGLGSFKATEELLAVLEQLGRRQLDPGVLPCHLPDHRLRHHAEVACPVPGGSSPEPASIRLP